MVASQSKSPPSYYLDPEWPNSLLCLCVCVHVCVFARMCLFITGYWGVGVKWEASWSAALLVMGQLT